MTTYNKKITPATLVYESQEKDITTGTLLPMIRDDIDITDNQREINKIECLQVSKGPPRYRSQRYILAYILFGGVMNSFFLRANLGIAIVCMVNHTAISTKDLLNKSESVLKKTIVNESLASLSRDKERFKTKDALRINAMHLDNRDLSLSRTAASLNNLTTNFEQNDKYKCLNLADGQETTEDGPFKWDKQTQGFLLGAMFWSYMAISFPGNAFIRNVSKKMVIAITMGLMSGSTLFIHVAAWWSPWAVFIIKLLHGGCTVIAINTIYGMWTTWAPPEERTGLIAICFGGSVCALAIVFPISGFLCKYGLWGGWPSIFYFFGLVGLLWTLIFVLFTADKPALHRSITREERTYIESSMSSSVKDVTPPTPWISILRSTPVWGVICLQSAYSWSLYLLLLTLPQYMKEVLKHKIDSNGLYTMVPFLMMWILSSVYGQAVDCVIRKGWIRLIVVRKVSAIIANFVPSILLIILSFMDCTQPILAEAILIVAVGVMGINLGIFFPTPYDIAPQFAQSIITLTNSVSSVNGILAPYAVATITKDRTREQWQVVFFITSAMLAAGAVAYCIMAKVDIQHWALPENQKTKASSHDHEEATIVNE